MKSLFVVASLFLSVSAASAQHNPFPDQTLAEVRFFGGVQHRAVIYKDGRVRAYRGARNSYIAELNAARVTALKALIKETIKAPRHFEGELKVDCAPNENKVYEIVGESGEKLAIESVSECGNARLKNRDQRIIDILDGLLALGDLL